MSNHLDLGKRGEEIASSFLVDLGYEILEKNWRFSRAEIDLIVKDGAVLVFVEVKTRSYDFYGRPEEFVSERKRQLIEDAASQYMIKSGHEWEIRYDVISVLLRKNGKEEVEHFKDAWF
ncbi:MAG: YraN family protein [Saprospiraceae bacterium]|nr:YraN family protein [Candidatus Vicinibacter affinis]MBK9960982.1 YraN family protein [Candidatus Vicinibacter affinis]HQX43722.1 YraN family protein [Saprospiraceae bacterium]